MTNPTVQKLVQITEEAAPAIHIPVFVGNEYLILTQQDVRRIEDVRYMTYSRIGNNGQLTPIQVSPQVQVQSISGLTPTTRNSNHLLNLTDFVQKLKQITPTTHADEDITPDENAATIATVSQQLKWSKGCNTKKHIPLTYSAATSTSELQPRKHVYAQCSDIKPRHRGCQTQRYRNFACNTEEDYQSTSELNRSDEDLVKKAEESASKDVSTIGKKKKRLRKTHFLCV